MHSIFIHYLLYFFNLKNYCYNSLKTSFSLKIQDGILQIKQHGPRLAPTEFFVRNITPILDTFKFLKTRIYISNQYYHFRECKDIKHTVFKESKIKVFFYFTEYLQVAFRLANIKTTINQGFVGVRSPGQ